MIISARIRGNREIQTETYGQEGHVPKEAEADMMPGRPPSELSQGAQPCQHLDLRLLASRL